MLCTSDNILPKYDERVEHIYIYFAGCPFGNNPEYDFQRWVSYSFLVNSISPAVYSRPHGK